MKCSNVSVSSGFNLIGHPMVELSDNGDLMNKFPGLPFPRMFMDGTQNAWHSYLNHVRVRGVTLAEPPDCGHFPMYSNPVLMWQAVAAFHQAHRE